MVTYKINKEVTMAEWVATLPSPIAEGLIVDDFGTVVYDFFTPVCQLEIGMSIAEIHERIKANGYET